MTILVVEDHGPTRELMVEMLCDEGYLVVAVGTAEEALDVLQSGAGVSLVLLDLMLPVMSGQDLCGHLRADPTLATIPVVLVSAVAKLDQQVGVLQAAAALPKPFDLRQLLEVVERLYTPAG